MALILDTSGATISVDKTGAKCDIKVGTRLILLHGTRNANLAAADTEPPGKGEKGPFIILTGKVFLEATANEFDIGAWEFGIIQVSTLAVYEFLYAGRMTNEGGITINLKSGFTKNPSLDLEIPTGGTVNAAIFDINFQTMKRVTKPKTGFQIEYALSDHPSTIVPRRIQNRATNAPNFILSARRDEGFVTYFVARENANAPIQFLSRVGWHAIWHGTFKWSARTTEPTVTMVHSRLDVGSVLLGTPAAGTVSSGSGGGSITVNPEFAVAKARPTPTTNVQDTTASTQAFVLRSTPVFTESVDRPKDTPADFFA